MRSIPAGQYALAVLIGVIIAFAPIGSVTELLAWSTAAEDSEAVVAPADEAAPLPVRKSAASLLVRSQASLAAENALQTLSSQVTGLSHQSALEAAFKAYFNYRDSNPGKVRKPYLYFVDFGLSNLEPRGWVFDMDALRIVEGPFTVAAGGGSAADGRGIPTRFSNRPGSKATSLGLFVTRETYGFSGKSNGTHYRSVGLRMDGVSGSFNSAAYARGVVIHGAPYVTASRAGRSEGCPAMEPARAQRLLPMIANGALVFLYSPNDREWARNEPWTQPEFDYVTQLALQ